MADGAKASKLEVKKSGDLAAGADLPGIGSVPELDAILFGPSAAVGAKGSVVAPGGAIAYEITKHDVFDPAKFESGKGGPSRRAPQQRRDQLTQGLIENLRQKHTIEINQPLVDGVNG